VCTVLKYNYPSELNACLPAAPCLSQCCPVARPGENLHAVSHSANSRQQILETAWPLSSAQAGADSIAARKHAHIQSQLCSEPTSLHPAMLPAIEHVQVPRFCTQPTNSSFRRQGMVSTQWAESSASAFSVPYLLDPVLSWARHAGTQAMILHTRCGWLYHWHNSLCNAGVCRVMCEYWSHV